MTVRVGFELKGVERLGRIARGIREGAKGAHVRPGFKRSIQRGVTSHFGNLGLGGGGEGSGITDASGNKIFWPSSRDPRTVEERAAGGKGPFPLLDFTGQMKGAFTDRAVLRSTGRTKNTVRVKYMATDAAQISKAKKHHQGGRHRAVFQRIGDRPSRFRFPKRPFMFWDTQMAGDVTRDVRIEVERRMREAAASRGGAGFAEAFR